MKTLLAVCAAALLMAPTADAGLRPPAHELVLNDVYGAVELVVCKRWPRMCPVRPDPKPVRSIR